MSNNEKQPPMSSVSPYLLRALHQWILDNNQTPNIMVNTRYPGTVIPPDAQGSIAPNGLIMLNISYNATTRMNFGDEFLSFTARFNRRSCEVFVPINAIMSVFSRESGLGMSLQPHQPALPAPSNDDALATVGQAVSEAAQAEDVPPPAPPVKIEGRRVGHLTVVK